MFVYENPCLGMVQQPIIGTRWRLWNLDGQNSWFFPADDTIVKRSWGGSIDSGIAGGPREGWHFWCHSDGVVTMQAMGSGCGVMELWDGEQWLVQGGFMEIQRWWLNCEGCGGVVTWRWRLRWLCSNVGKERLRGQWPAMAKASWEQGRPSMRIEEGKSGDEWKDNEENGEKKKNKVVAAVWGVIS